MQEDPRSIERGLVIHSNAIDNLGRALMNAACVLTLGLIGSSIILGTIVLGGFHG